MIKPVSHPKTLRSSSRLLVEVPRSHTVTYNHHGFSIASLFLWNSLPEDINKRSNSVDTFKAPVPGHPNFFVGIFAPSRMIKYIYDNQDQLFILLKHALVSLYLRSFNKWLNRSHSMSTITNDRPHDWCLEVEQTVKLSSEIPFSGYCTTEIETICMILYM